MIRIAHFGAYGLNLGDTVAINNIRIQIEKHTNEQIEWVPLNIKEFHDVRNSIAVSNVIFGNKLKNIDALIIGGGGLVEAGPQHNEMGTGWKLPFSSQLFKRYNGEFPPIYIVGVGINYFRGYSSYEQFPEEARKNLINLVNRSRFASVRNDGSLEKIQQLLANNLEEYINSPWENLIAEVPDPGLIYDYEIPRRTVKEASTLVPAFQPAFNSNRKVMAGRGFKRVPEGQTSQRSVLNHFIKSNNLKILPHTPKDFRGFESDQLLLTKDYMRQNSGLDKYKNMLEFYNKISCSIAMRGHGQMIALALNVPSVYLSTQEKVLNFSQLHDLMDYNVDIKEKNWEKKLQIKLNKICNDEQYRLNWYNKRDSLITNFKKEFDHMCSHIIKDIEQLKRKK